jgi:hypothetical protein
MRTYTKEKLENINSLEDRSTHLERKVEKAKKKFTDCNLRQRHEFATLEKQLENAKNKQ